MVDTLLGAADLPRGFTYPRTLLRLVDLGLTNLHPWWILTGDLLTRRNIGVSARYPARHLVLFAARQDNDDVACFDRDTNKVAILHDFAPPGYEGSVEIGDFDGWLRQAIDDFIAFE